MSYRMLRRLLLQLHDVMQFVHSRIMNDLSKPRLLLLQVREPAAGVFSAETMLRNMGVDLPWSLTTPLAHGTDVAGHSSDPRFQVGAGAARQAGACGQRGSWLTLPGRRRWPTASRSTRWCWSMLLLPVHCMQPSTGRI